MSYQVSTMYDGKKIIPAVFISFKKVFQRSGDGVSRFRNWEIVITGQIVAFAGSPNNAGTFWTASGYPPDETPSSNDAQYRIANLRNKLRAISELFATDGKWFQIQPGDGSATIKFQPKINRINYNEGQWFNTVPFSIEMEADCVYWGDYAEDADACNLGQNFNPPEETWSLEQTDEFGRAYKLTHVLTSNAKRRYDADSTILAEGWEIALDNIIGGPLAGTGAVSYLGIDGAFLIAADVLDLNEFEAYNYTRNQQTDIASGKVTITETWYCFDSDNSPTEITTGKASEELIIENRFSNDNGLYTVTINGTVNGLEERNNTTRELSVTRYENAILRFNAITASTSTLLDIAEEASGVDLNPESLSTTVSRNKISGVIQYSKTYDTRPALSDSDFLSEIYTVTIEHAADVFAKLGVIGRLAGPILQDIGSTTETSITIGAEIVVRVGYGLSIPTSPSYDSLAVALSIIGIPSQLFVASDREVWVPRTGRYSRNTTFVYQ